MTGKRNRKSGFLRTVIFLSAVISSLSLCGCSIVSSVLPAKTLTGIVSLNYGYSAGTYAYSGRDFPAEMEDGRVTVTMRPDGSLAHYIYETGPEFMDQLTEIANEYKISSWDGFHKSNSHVMDGDSFSFSLKTDSGQSVRAEGYVRVPKNYREAAGKIRALFENLESSQEPVRIEQPEAHHDHGSE